MMESLKNGGQVWQKIFAAYRQQSGKNFLD